MLRTALFSDRARAYRRLGDKYAALRDFEYSVLSSPLRNYSSFELCELEIELGLDWSAVEDCRKAFDFNLFVMSGNPELAAKIGEFLLADGDLKGACRLAFPWFFDDDLLQMFSNDARIKDLQRRIRAGLKGAELEDCGIDYAKRLNQRLNN